MRLRTLGAALVGTLALGACEDPTADTDLRPEGPPDVLAVLVFNDTENTVLEAATYCKPNDEKRPGKVGIPLFGLSSVVCPLDGSDVPPLTNAWPDRWYVRIVFDELLDPDIETLIPINDAMGNPTDMFSGSLATTQPVSLKCEDVAGVMTDVPYDGYYSPAGNNVTWPLGPSLVIKPNNPTIVPVESRCQVQLKDNVKDKDSNGLVDRDRQPFEFRIAPVTIMAAAPHEADPIESINPADGGVELDFNVRVDRTIQFCADPANPACFSLTPAADATNPYVDNLLISGVPFLFVGADLLGNTTYTFKAPPDVKIKDKCGKESTIAGMPGEFQFKTNPARFTSFNPGGGNAVIPFKKITMAFNQVMDFSATSFEKDVDWVLTPEPEQFSVGPVPGTGNTQVRFFGQYNLSTKYTLTIKAGASVKDFYGRQTVDFPTEQKIEFTTAPSIQLTAQSPANGARIAKAPTAAATISLTFNQELVAGTLCGKLPCTSTSDTVPEFTLTKSDGTPAGVDPTVAPNPNNLSVLNISYAALPAGSYRFTLKAGATIEDKITINRTAANTYSQASDRVINFTVADSIAPPFKCLGQP